MASAQSDNSHRPAQRLPTPGKVTPVAPDDTAVWQLVNQTMRSFSDALQRNDFGAFHADDFRQVERADHRRRAEPSVSAADRPEDEPRDIQSVDPTFAASPAIDQEGLLVASGSYPTEPRPGQVQIELHL